MHFLLDRAQDILDFALTYLGTNILDYSNSLALKKVLGHGR
jgi:hypothetical protein